MARSNIASEPFRERGAWWLPEQPDVKFGGELRIDQHSAPRLDLEHVIADGDPDRSYPIVLGTTSKGEPVTLESAQQFGSSSVFSNRIGETIKREVLLADWAYLGAHFPDSDARRFDDARVELTDLLVWAGQSGLHEQLAHEPDLTVSVTLPPPLVADVPGGHLTLNHGWATYGDLRWD